MRIVPDAFDAPLRFEGSGYHLEPLGPVHNEQDHAAWMGSIEHIRSTVGFPMSDGWPYPMPLESNLSDLEGHLAEFGAAEAFAYSVLDGNDVIGCVYITPDPSTPNGVRIRSWVVASRAELDGILRAEMVTWLEAAWPFSAIECNWD